MRSRIFIATPLALVFALAPASALGQGEGQPPPSTPPQDDATPPPSEPAKPDKPPPDKQPPPEQAPPEGEAPVEGEVVEGEGADPARPPPKGKGVIWGVVKDTKLKEPVIEGQVTVVGTKFKTVTDLDGRYRLELPPGTYNLRFFYEMHRPVRVDGVKVTAGAVVQHDVTLEPEEEASEVMEVETEADRAAIEGQALARQRSSSVGDGIGRAEISKTPDANAAQAAQRVVGASIVGGRFVYVRGLGERYSNALLNGLPLPSPEPDRAAVPLDLFPAQSLDGLTISKTFTPHMPGDFAGGSLAIETRKIPTEFLLNVTLSGGFNTQSTFQNRLSHRGSSTDWLGYDGGARAKPDGFPEDYLLARSGVKPDGTNPTDEEILSWGRRINSYMSTTVETSPPNHGVAVVVGDGFRLGPEQRLGMLAALTYGRSYEQIEDGLVRDFALDSANPGQNTKDVEYSVDQGSDLVRWGALGSISFEPHTDHRLTLIGFRSQLSDKVTTVSDGTKAGEQNPRLSASRLSFVSRSLNLVQVGGEHTFKELESALMTWTGSYAIAQRDEPDTRDTVYTFVTDNPPARWTYNGTTAESGRHFWSEQSETSIAGALNWTQPIPDVKNETKLLFGGLVSLKERDFQARRFNFPLFDIVTAGPLASCEGASLPPSCPDKLFVEDNIGTALTFSEGTQKSDAYVASLDVLAAYVEADVGLTHDLRVVLGERLERTVQTVDPVDRFRLGGTENAALRSTDLLPSISLMYSATQKAKLRAAFTRTLARPQVRELAPFSYTDYFNGRNNGGEPDLKLTKIWNADLRFEFFPTLREVAAFSIFYKNFKDPIEPIIVNPNIGTFDNAEGANLIGTELETRKTLDFLAKALKDFTAIFNVTLATSRIQVVQEGESPMTNVSRPLVHQAPYVLNLALDYANEGGTGVRVLYNVVGRRIVQVGTGGLQDIYEQPRHTIDLTGSQDFLDHFQVKLTVRNLLNAPVRWTQGKENVEANLTRRHTTGTVYTISVAYNY